MQSSSANRVGVLLEGTRRQLSRYILAGAASNAALYVGYLALSAAGATPTVAMSVVYFAGVISAFLLNRSWTFDHDGPLKGALLRHLSVYAFLYVANVAIVQVLVNSAGMDHRLVMLALTLTSAVVIFLLQKLWVFQAEKR